MVRLIVVPRSARNVAGNKQSMLLRMTLKKNKILRSFVDNLEHTECEVVCNIFL